MTDPAASGTKIAVLGASGLIGQALVSWLSRQGFNVTAVARRFSSSQAAEFSGSAVITPLVSLDVTDLAALLQKIGADIVVNCLGVLQDGQRGSTDEVHVAFVSRLLQAIKAQPQPVLLVHVSIPGQAMADDTAFSRSKRMAETCIAQSTLPYILLRPGFVVAPAAYGGSALIRAVAALPFALGKRESAQAFMSVTVEDIARTVDFVARCWGQGRRNWSESWDVTAPARLSVGDVVAKFRHLFGGPSPRISLPGFVMSAGAIAGDIAAKLGWSPPVRSTALQEMRRGIVGDPTQWRLETAIEPVSLDDAVAALPDSVQEKWFARLYLLKAAIISMLVVFWVVSGLIALLVSFQAARDILTTHGWPIWAANAVTAVTSLMDITIGCLIANRKTCRVGLWWGIGQSLFYMSGAAIFTPEMWIEPLGALVKTGPAIVLMMVMLAILEER